MRLQIYFLFLWALRLCFCYSSSHLAYNVICLLFISSFVMCSIFSSLGSSKSPYIKIKYNFCRVGSRNSSPRIQVKGAWIVHFLVLNSAKYLKLREIDNSDISFSTWDPWATLFLEPTHLKVYFIFIYRRFWTNKYLRNKFCRSEKEEINNRQMYYRPNVS